MSALPGPAVPTAPWPAVRAYVALGSNLGDPIGHVRGALAELGRIPGTRRLDQSRLWYSEPLGPPGQPRYVNAVAVLETERAPRDLLAELQRIEAAHGRVRGAERWGPRTLDLDLLVYGDWRSEAPDLTVPHPRIADRPFVVFPLLEIEPGLRVPGLPPLQELAARLSAAGLCPVDR